jgi:DNA-binding response OmpR family regulator
MHAHDEHEIGRVRPNDGRVGGPPIVYLAEDDDDIRETMSALLVHDGFEVRAAPDGAMLFDWLFRERGPGARLPDVIVTDHRMPGYCALDILESLSEIQWTIPVIVITAYGSEVRSLAMAYGAQAVFEKPFDPDELRVTAMACVDWGQRRIRPGRPGAGRRLHSQAKRALRRAIDDLHGRFEG